MAETPSKQPERPALSAAVLVNLTDAVIVLPPIEQAPGGEKKRITLGAAIDDGVVGHDQPKVKLTAHAHALLRANKIVQGLVARRQIEFRSVTLDIAV